MAKIVDDAPQDHGEMFFTWTSRLWQDILLVLQQRLVLFNPYQRKGKRSESERSLSVALSSCYEDQTQTSQVSSCDGDPSLHRPSRMKRKREEKETATATGTGSSRDGGSGRGSVGLLLPLGTSGCFSE